MLVLRAVPNLGRPTFSPTENRQVLMRGPLLIFLVPMLSQFFERTEGVSTGQSPRSAGTNSDGEVAFLMEGNEK